MSDFEYNCDTYPSFGKKYNNEKAIISLTSWKARINTVSKTLYSLIKQCPDFHIVLVLSEEEFPKMMEELPDNLKLFVNNNLIELLFVYKNYKSFKKILFTMDKYKTVPVISADDDMEYRHNFAKELFDLWSQNKNNIIGNRIHNKLGLHIFSGGCGTIYPPNCFKQEGLKFLKEFNLSSSHDDLLYALLAKKLNIDNHISRNDNRCLSYQQASISLYETHQYNDEKNYDYYSKLVFK